MSQIVQRIQSGLVVHWLRHLLLYPDIIEALFSGDPSIHVVSEHFGNEVFGFFGDMFPFRTCEIVSANLDLLDNFSIIVSVEGRSATQQNVEDNTDTPDITFLIVLGIQHFRGDVVSCAICLSHFLLGVELLRSPEIDHLYLVVILRIHQNVLGLQVSVANVLLVTVSHC